MINIAIIDDEPLVRASIQSFLDWESHGFTFIGEASDGEEGLELLRSQKNIQLILLDMHMPRMNGVEFLKELSTWDNPPKVIVLSANDQYSYVRESFRLGAIDYILKMDIDDDSLLAILKKSEKIIETDHKTSVSSKDVEYMTKKLVGDIIEGRNIEMTLGLLLDIEISIKTPLRLILMWLNQSDINIENKKDMELIALQAKQFLKKRGEGCVVSLENGELLFILNGKDDNLSDQYGNSFCNDFTDIIKDSLDFDINSGFSPICDDITRINEYYKYVKALQNPESRMIRKAKKYIRENFKKSSLSLDDVSDYVEISKAHLSAQFKKETKLTFRCYLTRVRVEEAKKLLQNTNLKVYEISEEIGYPNVEHFSRIFKKETGMTPNKFASNRVD